MCLASDNAYAELIDCAHAGDYAAFAALASCLMSGSEVQECWLGTRARLGYCSAVDAASDEAPRVVPAWWGGDSPPVQRHVVVSGRMFAHPILTASGLGLCRTLHPDPVCACGAIAVAWEL